MEEDKRKYIENFVKSLYGEGSSPCEAFGVTLDQLADKTINEFAEQLRVPYPERATRDTK